MPLERASEFFQNHHNFFPFFYFIYFFWLQFFFLKDTMLRSWPSFDPHNFSQFKPNDPSNPSKTMPVTYRPTDERTLPPPDQVIAPESKNILLRHFYQQAEQKLRPKRASCDNPVPERASKVPWTSPS